MKMIRKTSKKTKQIYEKKSVVVVDETGIKQALVLDTTLITLLYSLTPRRRKKNKQKQKKIYKIKSNITCHAR